MFPDISVPICSNCLAEDGLNKTSKFLDKKAQELSKQLLDSRSDSGLAPIGKVKDVLSEVYDCFGGPTGFASHLYYVIMELSKRKPMPASAGNLLLQLLKLHHGIEQTEENINAREMTDEQLRKQREIEVTRIMLDTVNSPEKLKALETMLEDKGMKIEQMPTGEFAKKLEEKAAVPLDEMKDVLEANNERPPS